MIRNNSPRSETDPHLAGARQVFDMKRAAGCERDQDLAQLLGVSKSAVAKWRQRGAVPERVQVRFHSITLQSPQNA